jgi:uncharacterized membrane protein YfcA
METPNGWNRLETNNADEVIDLLLRECAGRPCFTCSFQAEDVVVLHLLRERLPDIPVLFLETGYHFAQTYEFRDQLTKDWQLNLVNVVPKQSVSAQESELGILYSKDPTKCCQLRKDSTAEAIAAFETWFGATRTICHQTELKEGRISSIANGRARRRQPPGRLVLGPSLGVHRQHQLKYLPQCGQGCGHRLRTVHGSRAIKQSTVRAMEWKKTRMWNPHIFGAVIMTYLLLGFVIAVAVGLTGIGGGSFTVPVLLLIAGLPAAEAVGTTFVFAGILRLIAAPYYLASRQVHSRYFRLLLLGAVPGLVLGMLALRALANHDRNPAIIIVVGALLTFSSSVTLSPESSAGAHRRIPMASLASIPHRPQSGFRLLGRGVGNGTAAQLLGNGSGQVVGTDLLSAWSAAIGSNTLTFGSISTPY